MKSRDLPDIFTIRRYARSSRARRERERYHEGDGVRYSNTELPDEARAKSALRHRRHVFDRSDEQWSQAVMGGGSANSRKKN